MARIRSVRRISWPRSFGAQLAIIATLALCVRLVYALAVAPGASQPGDSGLYQILAYALANGQGYSTETSIFAGHPVPTAEHPPLYALFLAVFDKLGVSTIDEHRAVSCLLGTAAVVLIGLIGRRLGGPRTGVIAALLAALYPQLFFIDGTLISESLYVPLVALSLLLAYRLRDRPTPARAALLGAAVGLATLTRPDGIVLLVLLAAPVIIATGRFHWVSGSLACAVACGLVLSPWLIRNEIALHRFPLISTNGGLTAPAANCDQTFFGRHTGFVNLRCAERIPACQNITQEVPLSQCLEQTAITYVEHHKRRLPVVLIARVARAFQLFQYNEDLHYAGTWGRTRGVAVAGLVLYAWLVPLAIGGVVLLRRRRVPMLAVLALIVQGIVVPASSFGFSRYRVAADVALVVLAAVPLGHVWERTGLHHEGRLAPVSGQDHV